MDLIVTLSLNEVQHDGTQNNDVQHDDTE
jgi:hypothetical protein